jgi:hypothetical protein
MQEYEREGVFGTRCAGIGGWESAREINVRT